MQVSQWEEKEAEHPHPLDPQFPQQAKSGGRNGTTDCLHCGRTALKELISDWLHSVEWHQQFGLHPPVCWRFQEGRCLAETLVQIVDRRLWMLSSAQPPLERDSTYEVQHKVQCSHHTNLEYHILVNTTIIFLILQGKKGGIKKTAVISKCQIRKEEASNKKETECVYDVTLRETFTSFGNDPQNKVSLSLAL